jgi:hypothetical protein
MDASVVRNALGSLDKLLSDARSAVWDIEREVFGVSAYEGEAGGYENPRGALKSLLEQLHDVLLVVLEAAGMPESRASLVTKWHGFTHDKGLEYTNEDHTLEFCESPALTFLEHLIQGLRISTSENISSEEAWTLARLEAMLRDAAVLVRRRGLHVETEADLQHVMHDYLRACFPEFRLNPPIGGTLKNFKPDCGIASVGAAVEFKVVHSEKEIATAFSGVAEDTAGYRGSKDWTRFYAVIYQAEPFLSESELRSDLKRIGAGPWKAIVVNGPTKPRAKNRAKTKEATTEEATTEEATTEEATTEEATTEEATTEEATTKKTT